MPIVSDLGADADRPNGRSRKCQGQHSRSPQPASARLPYPTHSSRSDFSIAAVQIGTNDPGRARPQFLLQSLANPSVAYHRRKVLLSTVSANSNRTGDG